MDDTLPINIVEKTGFVRFIERCLPFKIPSRKCIRDRLFKKYFARKQKLKTVLSKIDYVSTTTDVWSSRRKSFLGVTVHWFGADALRRSACLAIRRVHGNL